MQKDILSSMQGYLEKASRKLAEQRRWAILLVLALLTACSTATPYGHGDVVVGKKAIFRHKASKMQKLECTECHDKLFINAKQHKKCDMEQVKGGESCGTCHNGNRAFSVTGNCDRCHKKQG